MLRLARQSLCRDPPSRLVGVPLARFAAKPLQPVGAVDADPREILWM
ncbi:MAG: hypothetical protein MZW92_69620 [Comamonadaceae bacterium]|nr:hypothetical protein [Comamonadaceae bacterium]